MDPVNKWLTAFLFFGILLIVALWNSGGSGRYQMQVVDSLMPDHDMVYVIDTKTGKIEGKLSDQKDRLLRDGQPQTSWDVVRPEKSKSNTYRRY